jgi:hypothetical protein
LARHTTVVIIITTINVTLVIDTTMSSFVSFSERRARIGVVAFPAVYRRAGHKAALSLTQELAAFK